MYFSNDNEIHISSLFVIGEMKKSLHRIERCVVSSLLDLFFILFNISCNIQHTNDIVINKYHSLKV